MAIEKQRRDLHYSLQVKREMMIEGRFSNVLRNVPRMKFQREIFEERTQDANKIHMK